MPGTSSAVTVMVRVKASPTFGACGSGFHSSFTLRLRAAMTTPSPSAPGGVLAGKRRGLRGDFVA